MEPVDAARQLATLDDPVRSQADLKAGKGGDEAAGIRRLDELNMLIRICEQADERRRLMKQLLKMLLLGVLTPNMIRQAKALGLESFLKDAIVEMLKRGKVSPKQALAIAGLLHVAGIAIPKLDGAVTLHVQDARKLETDLIREPQLARDGASDGIQALRCTRTLGLQPLQ